MFVDRAATTERALTWIDRAAGQDVQRLALGETFLPGYPMWLSHNRWRAVGRPDAKGHAAYLDAPSRSTAPRCADVFAVRVARARRVAPRFSDDHSQPAARYRGGVKVHHLNCGTMCPFAARHVVGHDHIVCHCLLVETEHAGLVLIETGYGTLDIHLADRIPKLARATMRPRLELAETAIAQVRALGFDRDDVRHIVLTHLHLDHAGGISDFPKAQVHVHAREHYGAVQRETLRERNGYVASQWAHSPLWQTYPTTGEDWFGFDAVRPLRGLGDAFALVPLFGHTRGHSGVAVDTGSGWLLHAGDAYFHRSTLEGGRPPLGLAALERLDDFDTSERKHNAARLAQLRATHAGQIDVFCAHDAIELARCHADG